MQVSFVAPGAPDAGVVVVAVLDDRTLSPGAAAVDERTGGALTRAMAASRFRGGKDQSLTVPAPAGGFDKVVLIGFGKAEEIDARRLRGAGGRTYAALAGGAAESATVLVDALPGAEASATEIAVEMAIGARLRSYRFDKYKTKETEEDKPALTALAFAVEGPESAAVAFQGPNAVVDGVTLTRDLVSEPGNIIYPETLAAAAQGLADIGVDVEVIDEAAMRELGMGALLGVAQGSAREPKLVVMRWRGKGDGGDSQPVAFVGKGVTFDTGGISIKPSAGMEEMKYDMAGAGAVIGLMKALAGRKARVDAVGVVGLVENMPSGTAQRPGDIVTTMSGQTVEVLNTDAEGRLVLADALWYTQDRFKPAIMIDLATLTGAMVIALGHERCGVFTNTDELATRLDAAGDATGEPIWRLPLGPEYDKAIKSDAADMKNIGNRAAGSITAAQFLQRFVNDTPWAHLDIAGVAWAKDNKDVTPKGASGFGVRLLDRLVADHYES